MNTFFKVPKGNFFDRDKVLKALDRASHKNLSRAGALVRTIAQRSMRYTTKWTAHAPAGKPPLAHKQNPLLRKLLFFAFDAASKSVVIGPVRSRRGVVPQLMEEGGEVRKGPRQIQLPNGLKVLPARTVRIAPHPFMGPALKLGREQAFKQWKDSVKKNG